VGRLGEFSLNLIFPCDTKAFAGKNGKWYFLGARELLDFEEFTELEAEIAGKIDDAREAL
jgi:hypothetical protein